MVRTGPKLRRNSHTKMELQGQSVEDIHFSFVAFYQRVKEMSKELESNLCKEYCKDNSNDDLIQYIY